MSDERWATGVQMRLHLDWVWKDDERVDLFQVDHRVWESLDPVALNVQRLDSAQRERERERSEQ